MASTPRNFMRCGCKLTGEGIEREHHNTNRLSERRFTVASGQNTIRHETISWWCNEDRQAEWICLDTGEGRSCEAGLSRMAYQGKVGE